MRAVTLKTEYMQNPCGIDILKPRLSWLCEDGLRQTAYEIHACCGDRELWNSGRIESGKMYAFPEAALTSRERVEWRVRLWDENGDVGPWSEDASFEMGLLEQGDYSARWINPELECDPSVHKPASYLRKRFTVPAGFGRG
mgnify:CR=1 FL=1